MTIWVGEIDGKALVYDADIQMANCPHIFLWDSSSKKMEKFIADITRKHIKQLRNNELTQIYIAEYKHWSKINGSTWLAEQEPYYKSRKIEDDKQEQVRSKRKEEQLKYEILEAERASEAERIAQLTPAERHKERLERLGKEYHGIRHAANRTIQRRVTHCYDCRQILDNSIDVECVACNWILCQCGACGCGYSKYY